ncbi:serine/threonine-protein kinase [Deinobacterium chartae]|uniref:Serine/threonine-protein kinase n=1 Tax=Deinobacterium chartae TaxID=521158 RepID=A0A841I454_9DEIO|nr:serine/threonine-protein kinase [Deinobacterium chartae]MBB6100103.1 serine/threonine-protein kinase [Deinobacterium chartae]
MQKYKIDYLIGTGQTALVYLAHTEDGLPVALKSPREEVRRDPEKAARFATEVNLSLRLSHPHLVRALAGKPLGEDAYLCLEYFGEGALDQHLGKHGRLPLEEALKLASQVALALAHVHANGILHRDVKAANVFLRGGNAFLGDFGVAIPVGRQTVAAGSPFYMAPEVYRDGISSTASDAYSMGVLAYELLSGTRPFEGDSYEALMAAHLSNYPRSLSARCPELPRATLRTVERALAKSSEERPSVAELAAALEGGLRSLRGEAEPAPAPEPEPERPLGRHGARSSEPAAPANGENPRSTTLFQRVFGKKRS